MKRTALVTVAAAGLVVGSFALFNASDRALAPTAHASPLAGDSSKIADVVEKVLPGVVNISTTRVQTSSSPFGSDPFFRGRQGQGEQRKRYGTSLGSGVIVSKKGYILTNNHVVAKAKDIKVGLSDGRELSAKVVGTDPKSDLAVLKFEGTVKGLEPVAFGDTKKMRLGEVVVAIGNPFGVGQTVTMGIVSAKGRANMGIVDYEDFIQTDAAINPGNSGGALINMKGELVGINTAILSRTGGYQGVGFAIPTEMAEPIMKSLISDGKVTRGYLGIAMQDVNKELAEALDLDTKRGVLVSDVMDASPAHRAGLERGDVIVRVNGNRTKSSAQLRNVIAGQGADKKVSLTVIRDGKQKKLSAKLTNLPEEQPRLARKSSGKTNDFGVALAPVTKKSRSQYKLPRDLDSGVVITNVKEGSVAEELGLEPGDVLLEVNRSEVASAKQFKKAYDSSRRRLALLVYRDGSTIYLVVNK
jgi:Do/DeqQ family serine protease